MPSSPRDRVVLVSGGAGGLGFEIARTFIHEGCRVALLDRSEEVKLAAEKLSADGGKALSICLDVTDEQAVQAALTTIHAKWGDAGILVNNAGITGRKGNDKNPVDETDLADWERVLETNLTSAFLLCRACLPSMKAQQWGRIVNMSSQAARTRTERANAHYAASKAALIGFSRTLALEVAGDGITVNCVAPGRITTPMTLQTGAEVDRAYSSKSAVGAVGVPADIATSVQYLASEEASFVTGAIMDVNGGYSMN